MKATDLVCGTEFTLGCRCKLKVEYHDVYSSCVKCTLVDRHWKCIDHLGINYPGKRFNVHENTTVYVGFSAAILDSF